MLITTRNRKEDLLRTLRHTLPKMPPGHETLVFDDGSTDGTQQAVSEACPEICLLRHEVGAGYLAARNRMMALAQGEFALNLDDDAEPVTSDFAYKTLRYFSDNPRCAVLAFAIYWGRERPHGILPDRTKPFKVNSFVGCGHMWRMEAWRSIPPYPEWFDFYGEENYSALHLLKQGWEIHYMPQVLVHHRVDLAARRARRDPWRYRRHVRAGILLMLLFYPLRVLPRYLAYSYWMQIRLRLLREREWGVLASLVWVLLEVVKKLPHIVRERTPLTQAEWKVWRSLPAVPIYSEAGLVGES